MYKLMMKCGHAANATNAKTGKPSCVICVGIHPGAEEIDENPPVLSGRKARCCYYGSTGGRNNEGPCKGKKCECEKDSNPNLAFFEYCPNKEFDMFYCGCYGWD